MEEEEVSERQSLTWLLPFRQVYKHHPPQNVPQGRVTVTKLGAYVYK
jgi:hypothetical protein